MCLWNITLLFKNWLAGVAYVQRFWKSPTTSKGFSFLWLAPDVFLLIRSSLYLLTEASGFLAKTDDKGRTRVESMRSNNFKRERIHLGPKTDPVRLIQTKLWFLHWSVIRHLPLSFFKKNFSYWIARKNFPAFPHKDGQKEKQVQLSQQKPYKLYR